MASKRDAKVRVKAGLIQPMLYGKLQSGLSGEVFCFVFFFFSETCRPSVKSPCIPTFLSVLPFDLSLSLIYCWVINYPKLNDKWYQQSLILLTICNLGRTLWSQLFSAPPGINWGQLKGCHDLETRGWGHLKTHSLSCPVVGVDLSTRLPNFLAW